MRVMIFFDLPTTTSKDIKNYNKFRKLLIDSGFLMMQFSIYTKLVLNRSGLKRIESKIHEIAPKRGLIQMMIVTEKQFVGIKNIIGLQEQEVINNDERLVIL